MRRCQAGQSLIELAIATPVLLLMLLSAFDVTVMVSDKVIAGYAARQGARLAAEIGGSQTNPSLTTAQIDADIVKNVLAVATAMNYSTLQEIDVYRPTLSNGQITNGNHINAYNPAAQPIAGEFGGPPFPISERNQIPPGETSIGIRVVWQYNPPTSFATFSIRLSEYAVMKASPVLL
jgi:Flp pilus assembly protein TadG